MVILTNNAIPKARYAETQPALYHSSELKITPQ